MNLVIHTTLSLVRRKKCICTVDPQQVPKCTIIIWNKGYTTMLAQTQCYHKATGARTESRIIKTVYTIQHGHQIRLNDFTLYIGPKFTIHTVHQMADTKKFAHYVFILSDHFLPELQHTICTQNFVHPNIRHLHQALLFISN